MATDSPSYDQQIFQALVQPRHRHIFDKAVSKALASDGSDTAAYNFIRTSPASHGDRLLLTVAFACWRGYGPAVQVDQLSGMDAAVAERLLAGLATTIADTGATELLRRAATFCESTENDE